MYAANSAVLVTVGVNTCHISLTSYWSANIVACGVRRRHLPVRTGTAGVVVVRAGIVHVGGHVAESERIVGLLRISQDLGASPTDSSTTPCGLEHVVVIVQCSGFARYASASVLAACFSSSFSTVFVLGVDVVEGFHFFEVALHFSI